MSDPRPPVVRAGSTPTAEFPWGSITWLAGADVSGNEAITFGVVEFGAGQANPEHTHPNCDEVLYVVAGKLCHTLGEEVHELSAGDLIQIPRGVPHRAWNPGEERCRVVVAYNTGRRQVVGEFGR
ncbi:MAG: cupin domain-containing protein [Armatimonadetes bacterium]|nr:cupin domain-containing protein [Armatimonadota bacterium]